VDLTEKLKRAMFDAKLTQEQLAKKMGITQSAISQFLKNKNGLNVKTLEKYAKATKKNLDWFFDSSIKDVVISSGSGSAIGRNAKVSVDDKEVELLKKEISLLREENTFLREQNATLKEQLNSRKTYVLDERQ
jgi:transcriptional regulator with XRE-family HTH domain